MSASTLLYAIASIAIHYLTLTVVLKLLHVKFSAIRLLGVAAIPIATAFVVPMLSVITLPLTTVVLVMILTDARRDARWWVGIVCGLLSSAVTISGMLVLADRF